LGAEDEKNKGGGGEVGERWEKKKDGLARTGARVVLLPRTKAAYRILEEGMAGVEACEYRCGMTAG
jgi:hypothetical protein